MGKKELLKSSRAVRLIYFSIGLAAGTAFVVYLGSLYNQLTLAFSQEEQFVPTRIYSDVSQILVSQPRAYIERKLKSLGYNYKSNPDSIQFTLHPVNYPPYLIPEGNPMLDLVDVSGPPGSPNAKEKPITLQFESKGHTSPLQSIEIASHQLTDIYLEPEQIATLSRGGEVKKEIRSSLKFSEIPAPVWKAIIAVEDQHFLEHKGLDPRGIARAFWVNLKTFSLAQGGSTITQQLVKNLMARHTKNLFRKLNELVLAVLLELRFDKEEILERYLNEVYLGQVGSLEIHGVAEGAQYFFGKNIEDLNLAEITLMAGLIRGPGYYSPYRYHKRAIERQRLVLRKMVETGQIAEAEAKAAASMPIQLAPPQNSATKAPYFSDYVKAEILRLLKDKMNEQEVVSAGFHVYTTLNTDINEHAQRAVSEGITQLEGRLKLLPEERLEGALATVEQKTGYVRALVGGRNYSQSNFNRILNMKRQVGSTFKPVVYLTAFQQKQDAQGIPYGPGYPIEDRPWTLNYDRGNQSWSPSNYEKGFRGWITLKTALINSVNVAASKLGYAVGIDKVIQTARALGVESYLPNVPSLSLGVAELSPIELLRLYSTLGNRGLQNELTVVRGITQGNGQGYARFTNYPKQVADTASVDLLTDVLQGVFTEGTARKAGKMGFVQPAAGKTGTTNNHRDAWFAGYTPQLTAVVWVGLDQSTTGKKKSKVSLTGASGALPIWVSFMKAALANTQPTPFPQSPLLVSLPIDTHTGKAAKDDCPKSQVSIEKYIQENEPHDKTCEPNWPISAPAVVQD
ncbi:MAG: PBP1A family penicillin-binding protein [Bdellovibrionia bacterium]